MLIITDKTAGTIQFVHPPNKKKVKMTKNKQAKITKAEYEAATVKLEQSWDTLEEGDLFRLLRITSRYWVENCRKE